MSKNANRKVQSISLKHAPSTTKTLVPASGSAIRTMAPVQSKKEAGAAARRDKEKAERMVKRIDRDMDRREQAQYFTLQKRMQKKCAAYIGHPVRSYQKEGMRFEILALGRELSQFGEGLVTSASTKKGGYFTEDEHLAQAFRDGGLLARLEKLRAEVFCNRNLSVAFDSFYREPNDWARD